MPRFRQLACIDPGLHGAITLFVIAIGCTLSSCASAPNREPAFNLASGHYAASFEHAKRVLIDHGFELDRVDFREGIITTRPKATSGLATPWHGDQSTPGDEFEDLLNRHRRIVRVSFKPANDATSDAVAAPRAATVEVSILREHRPGRRLEPKAVRFSTVTRDESLVARGLWPRHETPLESDDALARRLAAAMDTQASPSP